MSTGPARLRSAWPIVAAGVAALAATSCAPAHDARTLFKDLQSPDVEAREDAAAELEAIVRKGDYAVFLRGVESSEGLYKAQSIVYLARVELPEARQALRELLRVERRSLLPYNPIRMKPASEETDSRILVASLIQGRGGDPEAVKALTAGMDDQPPEVLGGTCFAVGALRDPQGIPFLVSAARHPDPQVVRAAVQALGRFRQPDAVAALKAAASNPAIEVRSDVLTSLQLEEDPQVIDILKGMGATDAAPEIRAAAMAQVSRFKDPTVVPYLIERLRDRDASVRMAAAQMLGQMTGQTFGLHAERWTLWWSRNQKVPGRAGT
ncbi:MAG TPA: HEAT repeat domain-containing protein [Candidatus Polarisedimenticolia bacterium]|nr:HEAT repeat domain-containing protein [Candidatus Polarisedimenticolia bacterium]